MILLRCLFTLDPDLGWHITSGQAILTNGLPQTDIYTYTASSYPWIHHEWLADVINALVYNLGGMPLLALLYAGLWTAAIGLMTGKQNLKGALAALITVMAIAQFIAIRDTAWTALLLAVTHQLYNRSRAYVPLLFVLWANLHGGFVVGLAYILWRIMYERRWHDIWIFIAAFAATIINPYGLRLYHEIAATMLDPALHTRVNEWQRWAIDGSMIILPILWLGAVAGDVYKGRWRGIVRFDTFMLAASFLSLRHFVLFGLVALPRITKFYSRLALKKLRAPKKVFTLQNTLPLSLVYLAGLVGAALLISSGIVAFSKPLQFNPQKDQPAAAVASLKNKACNGNIFNDYDIGGYLIWQYPEQKIYIDGRMPSWQHDGTYYMDEYFKILKDTAFQQTQFDKYHITCAILPNGSKLTKSLRQQGWQSEADYESGWTLLRQR